MWRRSSGPSRPADDRPSALRRFGNTVADAWSGLTAKIATGLAGRPGKRAEAMRSQKGRIELHAVPHTSPSEGPQPTPQDKALQDRRKGVTGASGNANDLHVKSAYTEGEAQELEAESLKLGEIVAGLEEMVEQSDETRVRLLKLGTSTRETKDEKE